MSDRKKRHHFVHYDWLESQEGKEFLGILLRRNKRRIFGILEKPALPSGIAPPIVPYKLLLLGKAAVGKTSTVAKLAGKELASTYAETPGIQTTLIYWPAKLISSSEVVLFQLHFWDVGDYAMKKFEHIKKSSQMKPDAVIFFFFIDRASFDDLPFLITRTCEELDELPKITIGTKFDKVLHSEVTEEELRDFQEQWQIPVLKTCNKDGRKLADGSLDGRAGLMEVAPILNKIVDVLLKRREEKAPINKITKNSRSAIKVKIEDHKMTIVSHT
ncbi:LOW QUALITY PROTEIN: ciliogenesis and planar polarity effector 2-like [Xenia sp. Carnegie-2017]|uniref:LOW QUALITY PROTEIN: ciliogenesis and planar polarity effector 2-like n=1 Tax=Xenia sp. Carnegie-2017 TaxID=2897299 RepID=UPI001F046E40|nr:LOW QUALITY PROTEIN: ciliogenesis and planar polarity effector 2-like [Xenia sp. Carnegie-2017]